MLAAVLSLLLPLLGIAYRNFTDIVYLGEGAGGLVVAADLVVTTLFLAAASAGVPRPIRVLTWPFLVVSLMQLALVLLYSWAVLTDADRLYGAGLAALTVSVVVRVPVFAALRQWWRSGAGAGIDSAAGGVARG